MKKRTRKRKRRVKYSNIIIMATIIATLTMIGYGAFKIVDIAYAGTKNEVDKVIDDNEEITEDKSIIEDKNDSEVNEEEVVHVNKSGYLSFDEDIHADDAKDIERMLNSWDYIREDGKKVAYLTFDDGPSYDVTPQILDILEANDVKATFFVLGSMVEKSPKAKENLKRMVDDGHAIGNHGYCHRYDILYPNGVANVENFMTDMKKSEDVMKSVLGDDFSTRVLRFPGGHSSWDTEALDVVLEEQNYASIDWNTLNGDAEGHDIAPSHLLNRLDSTIADLYGNDDVIVILMHDTDEKETTVQYLQSAIDYLKSLGYEFRTLK